MGESGRRGDWGNGGLLRPLLPTPVCCWDVEELGWDGFGEVEAWVRAVEADACAVGGAGADDDDDGVRRVAGAYVYGGAAVGGEVDVLAVHGFEALLPDGVEGAAGGAVEEGGGRLDGVVADGLVEGVTVEGADAIGFDLEAVLAVAGAVTGDVLDVRAVGPLEVGAGGDDLDDAGEGGPALVVDFEAEAVGLVAEEEGEEFAEFGEVGFGVHSSSPQRCGGRGVRAIGVGTATDCPDRLRCWVWKPDPRRRCVMLWLAGSGDPA